MVDSPTKDAATQQGLTRLRAELATDRDFAAGALTIETGPRIAVASLPLSVEPTSERASAAIDRLREDYVPRAFGAAADRVFVGGAPAEARDGFAVNSGWLPIVIVFVLALSFVLLLLAFRSIAIPLTAIAVNLLSVGAAYGILVLVFQKGVGADLLGFTQVERIDAWIPVFLFSVLFGLSMDYQVFLRQPHPRALERHRRHRRRDRPRRRLHGAPDHRRRGDHHRRLHRLRHRPARRLPGDGLRHRRSRSRSTRRSSACCSSPPPCACSASATGTCRAGSSGCPTCRSKAPRPRPHRPTRRRTTRPTARPRPRERMTKGSRHMPHDSHQAPSQRRPFPGWPWVAVALAFPVAGYIGWTIGGPVDTVAAALVGGALTGAGLGAVQWWAAKGALGRPAAWIGASAAGYAAGLAAGAALVGYDTDLGALALMGLVSGASLGAAQGLVLARQGSARARRRRGEPRCRCSSRSAGSRRRRSASSVEDQFTVFGAAGALLFMLLSGLLLARFTPSSTRVA